MILKSWHLTQSVKVNWFMDWDGHLEEFNKHGSIKFYFVILSKKKNIWEKRNAIPLPNILKENSDKFFLVL